VKQYTKPDFLFRIVNEALRDNNQDNLETIGPFAYLVFNFIGRRTHIDQSLQFRLHQLIQPAKTSCFHLYRGDYAKKAILEEYQHAAGQGGRYFRWICFVSTSYRREVAEAFVKNVLYEIELSRVTSADQFADLDGITVFIDEKKVLLRPGARFRVQAMSQLT